MTLLDEVLAKVPKFVWGTVTALGPLRVRLDGDTSAIPITVDTLIDPTLLTVSDRVHVEMANNNPVVIGRSGGTDASAAINAALATFSSTRPRRNRIINGNFRTNQRAYASATSMASIGTYSFDRWKTMTTTTSLTFTAAPQGQTVTISSADQIAQVIERSDVEVGDFVLSWEGTATGRVYKSGGSTPSFAASPITFTNDGLADVVVEFQANGATRTLGKVQFELGTTPTPFEVIPLAAELAQCVRYYLRVAPGVNGARLSLPGYQITLTTAECSVALPVTMRTTPTVAFNSLYWTDGIGFNGAVSAVSIYTAAANLPSAVALSVTFASNGAGYRPGSIAANGTTGRLEFTAEL